MNLRGDTGPLLLRFDHCSYVLISHASLLVFEQRGPVINAIIMKPVTDKKVPEELPQVQYCMRDRVSRGIEARE